MCFFLNVHVHGQFTDLCQQSLTFGFVLFSKVAGMTAQAFGTLSNEVIAPSLDLPDCEAMMTGRFGRGGSAAD